MIWGMDNKKYNTKEAACLFTDEKEASAYSPLVKKLGQGLWRLSKASSFPPRFVVT